VVATVIALLLVLTACGEDEPTGTLHASQVDPPFTVSDTALIDTDGAPYSLADDTEKRLTLVFFGYTNCPDICGAVMANLAAAMVRLSESEREQVDVVFVTTDPARDTGDVLRDYLDRFDPAFIGVTGDIEDIEAVGRSVAVGLGTKLASGGYDVDVHSTQVTGIDAADEAPVYWHADTSSVQFAEDVHTLLGGDS
jgi:protein SCO1